MDRKSFVVWLAAAFAVSLAGGAFAAQEISVDQQIQMARSLTEAQRQATMAANLSLSDAESQKFWPIYREYRNEVATLNDKMVALLKDFADNYDSMSNAKAKAITDGYLQNEKQRVELKAKYVAKYAKVLSAVQTARVLQIENKLDALVQVGLAKSIPLVQP
jgi:Spy/CpxP family protein refolding chaperone